MRDESISSFKAFRSEGYPSHYNDLSFKLWLDLSLFRICLGAASLLIAFTIILPGFRGKRRLFVLLRWLTTMIIGFFIVFCNFAPYWQYGGMQIRTTLKSTDDHRVNSSLGVMVGLRGVNVTFSSLEYETPFDYNEHFSWVWLQDKRLNIDYNRARLRGLPHPILWVAETFTLDYGEVRIGRRLRQTGWYGHIALWTAIPLFILANILLQMVIQYGALFLFFTGIALLLANAAVVSLQSVVGFAMAFESLATGQTELLTLKCSFCYYANFANGITCIVLGLIVFLFDLRWPDQAADFFGNDVLQSYEDYFADPCNNASRSECQPKKKPHDDLSLENSEIRLRKRSNGTIIELGSESVQARALKKRSIFADRLSRFQKTSMKKTKTSKTRPPPPIPEGRQPRVPDSPVYANFEPIGEEDANEQEL